MREDELLAHIRERSKGLFAAGATVLVGPGDDCAVVECGDAPTGPAGSPTPRTPLLLKVDQVVEGRHFFSGTTLDLIARKAVARAVSDIAAMGGTTMVGLCGAVLPADYADADALFDAVFRWANAFGCPLVGGDISMLASSKAGPLVLGMTIVGRPHHSRGAVLRSGAKAGDGVYVTGRLGNSLASGRHLTFEPRIREGTWLCDVLGERLHAMMDLSDGLGRDAGRLALASSTRLELQAELIPRHPDCASWEQAVADGEDYELLFTTSGQVPRVCPVTRVEITRIGSVLNGAGAVVVSRGTTIDVHTKGWEHD